MIRIAVVEDDPKYRKELCSYIDNCGAEMGESFQVTEFTDGIEIADPYVAAFDIIFLDIEMKHLDGMQAAKRIRAHDKNVIIIFITNLAQFAIQGYEVEALDYVLKPINAFAFCQELQRAVRKVKEKETFYLYIAKDTGMVRLDVSKISYIESQGHNVLFHSEGGVVTDRDSIKNLEPQLLARGFSRCNSSYLVNLAWVTKIEKNTVPVAGESLPVSRSRKKSFMEDLAKYIGGK